MLSKSTALKPILSAFKLQFTHLLCLGIKSAPVTSYLVLGWEFSPGVQSLCGMYKAQASSSEPKKTLPLPKYKQQTEREIYFLFFKPNCSGHCQLHAQSTTCA